MRGITPLLVFIVLGLSAGAAAAGDYARTHSPLDREVSEKAVESLDVDNTEVHPASSSTEYAAAVSTLAYSSSSEIFYFWLDGEAVPRSESSCDNTSKFAIRVVPPNEGLISQVKMAFLSGKQINVYWDWENCAGSAISPHYIKVYR